MTSTIPAPTGTAGAWTRIGADEANHFATEPLLSSSRTLPVLAITTPQETTPTDQP